MTNLILKDDGIHACELPEFISSAKCSYRRGCDSFDIESKNQFCGCWNDYARECHEAISKSLLVTNQDKARMLLFYHHVEKGKPIAVEGWEIKQVESCGHESCPVDAGCDHCKEPIKQFVLKLA